MKTKLTKIIMLLLLLALVVSCFVACGTKSVKISVMDGETEIASFEIKPGDTLSEKTVLAEVSKAGYEFVGLYVNPEMTEEFNFDKAIDSEVKLYAKFTQKTYYISVKTGDGESEVPKKAVKKGEAYEIPAPTKEGYVFTYYTYLDDNEDEQRFPQSGTYTFDDNVRLTAHWAIKTYTVKFHVDDAVTEQTVEHGAKVVLPTTPSKTGYTFVDWRLDGATAAFDKNTAIKANVDLYATFNANSYAITFDPDLGLQAVNATYGAAYQLTKPVKTGYTFLGFKRNGVAFAQSGTYAVAEDSYLTAEWAVEKYTVTFLNADGTEISKQENVEYGKKAQGISIVGYEVKGYYLDADFSDDKAFDIAATPISAATTLYVKKAAIKYTLTVAGWHEANIEVYYDAPYALIAPTDTENPIYAAKIGTDADNEWLSFSGYTYGGNAFAVTGTYTYAENITVTPVFEANPSYNKATVTFRDPISNTNMGTPVTVNQGETIAADAFPATEKAGYTFGGWFTSTEFKQDEAFTSSIPVNASISVYAKYTANNYTITIKDTNADGAVLSVIPVTFNNAYELADAVKKGFTFGSFTYLSDEGIKSFAQTGTYAFAKNLDVYASFTQNKVMVSFNGLGETTTPTAIAAKEGNQYDTIGSFLPESDPTKTGYTFKWWSLSQSGAAVALDMEVEVTTPVYAVFEANAYTITVKDTNAEGATLATVNVTYGEAFDVSDPDKFGFIFDHYELDSEVFDPDQHATYDIADDIVLIAVFAVDESVNANFIADYEKGYFKERATASDPYTYVFVTGHEYQFAGYTMASAANGSYINIIEDGAKFNAVAPGEFTLNLTAIAGGAKVNVPAKVVYSVETLSAGSSFTTMMSNAQKGELFQTALNSASDYVMDAGVVNFIPDLAAETNGYSAISAADANIVLTLGASTGGEFVAGAGKVSSDGLSFTFDNTGNVFTAEENVVLTFKSKYALNNYAVSYRVKFNTGVNVYTNEELGEAYADTSVSLINVMRNITAVLDRSEYREDGNYGKTKTIDLVGYTDENNPLKDWDAGTPRNRFGGGVYRRSIQATGKANNEIQDNISINGNYYTIDGTRLPYIYETTNRTDGDPDAAAGYMLGNVQIGIFMYRCGEYDGTGDYDDMTGVKYDNGQISFNNLRIVGNNIAALKDAEISKEGHSWKWNMLAMSASFNGITIRGGTLNLDNTTISNVNLGMMLHGSVEGVYKPSSQVANETQSTKLYMRNSLMQNCWGNDIYAYDIVHIDLINSKLCGCAGAAITFDDRPYANPALTGEALEAALKATQGVSALNSELTMDTYSAKNLTSWVNGGEPWFVAYGQAGAAGTLKTNLDAGVNANGLTIMKGEAFNFAILVNPTSESGFAYDKDQGVTINYTEGSPVINAMHADAGGGMSMDLKFFFDPYTDLTGYNDKFEPTNEPSGAPDEYEFIGGNLLAYNTAKDAAAAAYAGGNMEAYAAYAQAAATYFGTAMTYGQGFADVSAYGMHIYIPVFIAG